MPKKVLIEEIYTEASRIQDHEARLAFVREACGGDVDLQLQVEALLCSHADSRGAAEYRFANPLNNQSPDTTDRVGDRVGRYTLLNQIGEGGFGTVFAAEQSEPVRRNVALKILKPGMDARQIVLRFKLERQALALMDHPYIARVFDAGATASGRPFVAMEFVHGIPITRFCDHHRLSVSDRLRLFIKVCRAVHHAHQKGIVHRDLKPSNILVDFQEGDPAPKIIDFGIAKAIEQKPTQDSIHTAWHQFLGTPAYMSPEQTRPGEIDIDTRSDVYSLGVLLHELLVDVTPFEFGNVDAIEWTRIKRESPIVKPSSRLGRLPAGRLAGIALSRNTAPADLQRTVSGDLDWIVLKATEIDRERRYVSTESMARDLECFLEHRPIDARPPSRVYQLQKFVQRHRVLVGAGMIVLLALMGGLGAATWGARVAVRESWIARAEERKARESIDLLFRSFVRVVPAEGGRPDYTVREMLDDLTKMTEGGELRSKEVECAVRDMLSYFYNEFGELELATRHARRGLELSLGITDDPRLEATFHSRLGQILKDVGPSSEALFHLEKSLVIHGRVDGENHPNTIRVMLLVARVRQRIGDSDAGAAMAEKALRMARKQRGETWHDDQLVRCLHMLALIYQNQGRFEEQEPLVRERLELARSRNGDNHPETLHALADLGVLKFHRLQYSEAEALLSQALAGQQQQLGEDYPQTLETMMDLARAREALGSTNGAAELFAEVLSRSARSIGEKSPLRREWLDAAAEFFEKRGETGRATAIRAGMDGVPRRGTN